MLRAVAWSCFFLSGAAGLVYEVCWIRRASLVFGSTLYAVSTVLAVFFLGLAAGSEAFGRLSERIARPLRVYALLEVGLAALALLTLPAFGLADALYGAAYRSFAGQGPMQWLVRVALVSLVVLPPAFLMGGTLPLICRQFVVARSRIASPVGLLYALNTMGAAVGCAAAGFVLLPALGMQRTILVGVVLNLVAAAGVGLISIAREAAARSAALHTSPARRDEKPVLVLAFLAGFIALGNEVLWTRYLGLLVRNTVHTYTLTLSIVLVGIVLGSLVASRFYDRAKRRGALLGVLQVVTGLSVLVLMMLPPDVWRGIEHELLVYALLLMPPAIFGGAAFPLMVRMVVDDPAHAGRGVGRITASNTLGGILGALAVGFVALPALGLQRSVIAATGLSLATGFGAWWFLEEPGRRRSWTPVMGGILVLWLVIPRALGTRIPADFLAERGVLVDFREGLQSNLAVIRARSGLVLEIDRWWQGRDKKTHQIMAAHLPMLFHPRPRRVLVVGAGVGQTASRMTLYDLERLDCVDIEPVVFDLIRSHFETAWLNDPRTRVIRDDGRNFLMHTDARYDVIGLEVGQIFRPGVASFYTADFYRRARERLEPGGILSQFVPLPFLPVPELRSVIRTFLEVFPRSTLWYNTSELLLIGRNGGPRAIDLARLRSMLADTVLRADLDYSHWGGREYRLSRPSVLFASFLCGPGGLAALARGAPILTDDRPVLDHATVGVDERVPTELGSLAWLRKHLEPIQSQLSSPLEPDTLAAIATIREKNLADIAASATLRRVDLEGGDIGSAFAFVSAALKQNPESAEAHRLMGEALALQGRYDEARESYQRAAAMRPDDPLPHLGLAFAFQRQGRAAEAILQYQEVLALDPAEAEAHNGLGAALGGQGDHDAAAWHFEQAVRLRPGDAEARRNLEMARAAQSSKPR